MTDPTQIDPEVGLTADYVERSRKFHLRVNANVAKVRDAAKQLGRCANKGIYAWQPEDAQTIIEELEANVAAVREAFERTTDEPARNAPWDLTTAKRARAAHRDRGQH